MRTAFFLPFFFYKGKEERKKSLKRIQNVSPKMVWENCVICKQKGNCLQKVNVIYCLILEITHTAIFLYRSHLTSILHVCQCFSSSIAWLRIFQKCTERNNLDKERVVGAKIHSLNIKLLSSINKCEFALKNILKYLMHSKKFNS